MNKKHHPGKQHRKSAAIFSFGLLFLFVFSCRPALAHGVRISAAVHGDTILTESYFHDGEPCKDTEVTVFGKNGEELLHGDTDGQGFFSFKIPRRTDLKIVLDSKTGHRAEYILPVSDIPEITDFETNQAPARKKDSASEKKTRVAGS